MYRLRNLKYLLRKMGVIFIIMRPDGSMLMQLRDQNSKRYKNMWCFPGGKSDKGESFIQTTIREVYEEYGLKILPSDIEYVMSRYFRAQRIFLCRVPQDAAPIMQEGADMKWMKLDEIRKLDLGFEQANIISRLERYLSK